MRTQKKLPPVAEINEVQQTLFSDFMRENPYAFTVWNFPWKQKGFRLETQEGPRAWQKEILLDIGVHIKRQKERIKQGLPPEVYKLAVSSGRGVGKSALVSWLTLWMAGCHFGSTVIVSANTQHQLSDVTFGEIGKWLTMSNMSFMFEQTQMNISPSDWYADLLKKEMKIDTTHYYAQGKLWDEENPSGFAGQHSDIGMMVIFDEASGIPTNIWDVAQGYFSDKILHRYFLAFSNPRSTSSGFYDCFEHPKSDWNTRKVNALNIPDIDHAVHQSYIDKYGADSDQARVEVFGEFPKTGERQFISRSTVEEASTRRIENNNFKEDALIMGVDVARYGSDTSVIAFRAGRDARTIPAQIYSGLDNMQIVAKVEQAIYQFNPDFICIDGGAGAGVIDRLRELGYKIQEVLFGSAATENQYFDFRTELYARLRDWLPGGMIPNDQDLKTGLCAPEKELIGRESKEKLESKEKMKKRGIKSPDYADALALTFSIKGAKKNLHTSRKGKAKRYREVRSVLD